MDKVFATMEQFILSEVERCTHFKIMETPGKGLELLIMGYVKFCQHLLLGSQFLVKSTVIN